MIEIAYKTRVSVSIEEGWIVAWDRALTAAKELVEECHEEGVVLEVSIDKQQSATPGHLIFVIVTLAVEE